MRPPDPEARLPTRSVSRNRIRRREAQIENHRTSFEERDAKNPVQNERKGLELCDPRRAARDGQLGPLPVEGYQRLPNNVSPKQGATDVPAVEQQPQWAPRPADRHENDK